VTHKFTQCFILAVSALGLSALPALADSACTPGSLSTYVDSAYGGTAASNFSCFIGNLDFSSFTYISSSSNPPSPVPATSVTVGTLDSASAGIGFDFNSSWTAVGANEFSDAAIGFTVSVIGGGPATLEDAAVFQTAGIDATNSGSIAQVTENGCSLPGTPCSQQWAVMTSQSSSSTNFASEVFYSPVGSLSVSKDINAQDGTSPGAHTSISLVQDTFSEVPEPRSISLILTLGLLAGFAFFKRRQVTQS
jgi:hypothetical protein